MTFTLNFYVLIFFLNTESPARLCFALMQKENYSARCTRLRPARFLALK